MGPVRLSALRHATPAEVGALLADVAPATFVEEVRRSGDELLELLREPDRGPAVVEAVLARLHEYAVPGEIARLSGSVRWEAADLDSVAWTVALRDGGAHLVDSAAGPEPDLTVAGTAVDLVRLVAGQLDVAIAYLGGALDLHGDGLLALALASSFAVDGTPPVVGKPVDPRAIDPVEVSRALRGVPAEHLRSVLASDLRPVILDEILERMPSYVNGRKAAGLDVTVGFRLTGRTDGEVDRFVLRLGAGHATVLAGNEADAVAREDRDATVTCEAHDFLRLATGHLSPVTGVLKGQLRVRGDKAAALRLSSAFDIPTAAAG